MAGLFYPVYPSKGGASGSRGYSNYGAPGAYGGRGYYPQQQQAFRKKSGCRLKRSEDGKVFLYGWRVSRGRFCSFTASQTKKTKDYKSKSGKVWRTMLVVFTFKDTLQKTFASGLYDVQRERLYIKDYNLVANPRANNGGYFGQHIKREYSR